jgi:hypothetical protein
MSEENTGLVQFQELPAIAANAPAILEKNTSLLAKAIDKGQTLLDTIEGEGEMTPEIDEDCNKYMANCAAAVKIMNDKRKPITQMLTAVAKEFTRLENALDKDTPGTIPFKIQAHRNELARKEEAKRQEKIRAEERKRKASEEAIQIKAMVESKVRERYNQALIGAKQKYIDIFNTFDDVAKEADIKTQISTMPTFYPRDKFELISVAITPMYVAAEELAPLIYDTKMSFYDELNADFKVNMENHKHHLLEQLPARKQELVEMAKAGKAEKKRLQEAADERERQEKARLQQEEHELSLKASRSVEHNIQVGQAESLFDNEIATAEIMQETTQAVKQFYVIKVMTSSGWMQIANLWFKLFGAKTTLDKIGKKSLEAMKKDLETVAYNNGEKIADSGHLVYELDVKAITKK